MAPQASGSGGWGEAIETTSSFAIKNQKLLPIEVFHFRGLWEHCRGILGTPCIP